MVNNYSSLFIDVNGVLVKQADRINMFIPYSAIKNDGTFDTYTSGDLVGQNLGLTFIVDQWIPEQFEKLKIDNDGFLPKLVEREGFVVEQHETELQKQIRLKEEELQTLKSLSMNSEVM